MPPYVDGYVLPVPTAAVSAYREMAAAAGELWIEHGATHYFEGIGDDLQPDLSGDAVRTFPDLVDTEAEESVVFAFVLFESKAHRDRVNEQVMASMEEGATDVEMPFNPQRMAYAGFDTLVSLTAE